ncbi:DUF2264 domain-containing protein [Mucilaginibacter polytrichastri]|uniref:DUF2264 domain-containing protein n=1 Tax=Mucilaginibacter polytrichastri TaxID=1302689 RepID=A0A1Q5ZT34_9SPHI|nr:DUF2264 domain-containing protein [Mucilaginibacter polytrichastri]OKS84939.1 hypothetical protein RG47T_0377 [Mucilaginibacter polytrichastri]SFS47356.1 hypothetical protein SAMN04487890_101699 [Mucilaginibacter polytrichastri]
MKRILIYFILITLTLTTAAQKKRTATLSDRKIWLSYMDKVARPVLANLAADQLKEKMPVALSDHIDNKESRTKVAYLEAFGRTLSGVAPWLQLEGGDPDELKLRNQYREWALKAITNAVNPQAKDYLQWNGGQPLVDASYLALALIRSPWLWEHLDENVKKQVVDVMKITRNTVPVYSNWILFSGMIEAFLCKYDLGYDPVRVEYGIREFTQHWYVGDGMYSDGMSFHNDYYNSIVIHPNLSVILEEVNAKKKSYLHEQERELKFGQRYAELLERLIGTDGSYPPTGRSIVYRGGVFHHLSNLALKKQLPASLKPAQVRGALTAMIGKTLGAPQTFTADGWLNIGLYGKQPGLADFYITTGSLYICTNVFVALGLPETDEFWSAPAEPWTAVKVWSGQDVPADHALDLK